MPTDIEQIIERLKKFRGDMVELIDTDTSNDGRRWWEHRWGVIQGANVAIEIAESVCRRKETK